MTKLVIVAVALLVGLSHVIKGFTMIPKLRRQAKELSGKSITITNPADRMLFFRELDRVGAIEKPGIFSRLYEAIRWRKTQSALTAIDQLVARRAAPN
ncbi:MAG TPA: hypothetical protein VJC11_01900 [Patescibacteria group bacterium]|nr:hypothetical protein [Patescibacteria group bacterium]